MKIHPEFLPVARLYFRGGGSIHPGWYIQHYVRTELQTTRLEVRDGADAFDAVVEAAGYIGCVPEQIQIEGAPWPLRQFPM